MFQDLNLGVNDAGVSEKIVESHGQLVLARKMNVQPLLDRNRKLQNENGGFNPKASGRIVATVDAVTQHKWRKEYNSGACKYMKWMDFKKMKLNSRDYSKFRVWEGQL